MSYKHQNASSKNNNLSDREREVLERQRQLAASIKGSLPPKSVTTTTTVPTRKNHTSTTAASVTARASAETLHLVDSRQTKALLSLSVVTTKLSSGNDEVIDLTTDGDQRKRPSKRIKMPVAGSSSGAITSNSCIPATASLSTTEQGETNKKLPSPVLMRKKSNAPNDINDNSNNNGRSANALLAKLVNQASLSGLQGDGVLTNSSTSIMSSTFRQYEPNDFWRNLRDWDFISQFDQELRRQNQSASSKKTEDNDSTKPSSSSSESNQSKTTSSKSLPDTFINHRHYVASWAPLVMQEARAELISTSLSNVPNWISQSRRQQQQQPSCYYVEITVKTWQQHRDIASSSTLDSLTVQISPQHRADNSSMPFFANDLCLLLPIQHREILSELYSKSSSRHVFDDDEDNDVDEHICTFRKYGLVGQIEVSRKELNGLLVTVSKKWWAQIGQERMVIIKLGNNITALREFTALTRIESTPLLRYLLGRESIDGPNKNNNISSVNDTNGSAVEESVIQLQNNNHRKKSRTTVSVLLDKMGGVQALGKGFTDYAVKKFNPSQLTAISASSNGYGEGGFTLIKGPPGTGKTTTLVGVLNSLHIRQFNKYYDSVREIAAAPINGHRRQSALDKARKAKPRLLVCAPSNAAVDNVILKIMEDGFIDGSGFRYNPSMIRVGVGQSVAVRDVSLETKVDAILAENHDIARLEASMVSLKMELQRITTDISQLRKRLHAIKNACPWPLSKDWEIRIDEESFDETGRVYFLNHKEKATTFEVPPPPEPDEAQFSGTSMPEYRSFMSRVVKLVENYFSVKTNLERCTIVKNGIEHGTNQIAVRQELESHVLNSVHLVMTTLGTAGNRVMEVVDKFEVVVIDEAAQSVEPSTLSALQLGSQHCILVGDPQQLPATIFNMSGRNTKYDRSLFQRLEEAGQVVFMLNEQYRMHPAISHFPRHIFYRGQLLDGPNVRDPTYGCSIINTITKQIPNFKPFTVLNLDSKEERGGTSLSNSGEANLAVHLYLALRSKNDEVGSSRVAVITPYAQQASLIKRCFGDALGSSFERFVEVNTVDAFQGREASIVLFSAVRADGSKGIGFLSDVRRMNVALTRAKHFLFVLCRCESIVVNPYWRDLVQHARETTAVIHVPYRNHGYRKIEPQQGLVGFSLFGDPSKWILESVDGKSDLVVKASMVDGEMPDPTPVPPPTDIPHFTVKATHSDPSNHTASTCSSSTMHPPNSCSRKHDNVVRSDPRKVAGKQESQRQAPGNHIPSDPRKNATKPIVSPSESRTQAGRVDPRKAQSQSTASTRQHAVRQERQEPKQAPSDPRKRIDSNHASQEMQSDPRKRKPIAPPSESRTQAGRVDPRKAQSQSTASTRQHAVRQERQAPKQAPSDPRKRIDSNHASQDMPSDPRKRKKALY